MSDKTCIHDHDWVQADMPGWQRCFHCGMERRRVMWVDKDARIVSLETKIAELQALVSHLNTAYDDVLARAALSAEYERGLRDAVQAVPTWGVDSDVGDKVRAAILALLPTDGGK